MKLALGTAQFGMDYGISNRIGQSTADEVAAIISFGRAHGVNLLDTAPTYGTCETVLGQTGCEGSRVVTKTRPADSNPLTRADAKVIKEAFLRSLDKLAIPCVYGLLVHHADDLVREGAHRLHAVLCDLQEQGLVQKIGVSVYTGQQINQVLELFTPDIIQLPLNVFDQRLLVSGHLDLLADRGVEIHVRSAFLQGLLLMAPGEIPADFRTVFPKLSMYREFLTRRSLSPVEAALGFVLGLPQVDNVICGVNTLEQWKELIHVAQSVTVDSGVFTPFAVWDEKIIDPSHWKIS